MHEVAAKLDSKFDGLEADPVFLRKRRNTVVVFSIRMFLLGAEYAIILPSIWLYLKRFHVETWFLGLVVSLYPVGGIFVMPFVGQMFDKFKRTKEIVLVLNAFEIVGNVLYAIPYSEWFPLVGRLVSGFGDGFYSVANSEVIFTYRDSERTGIFALMELGRVLGLILGPSLNFFLQNVNFTIGSWTVDFATSPAVLMALLWSFEELLTLFFVSNLSRAIEDGRKNPSEQLDSTNLSTDFWSGGKQVKKQSQCDSLVDSYGDVSDKESLVKCSHKTQLCQAKSKQLESDVASGPCLNIHREDVSDNRPHIRTLDALGQMCCLEIAVLFYADLVLSLAQTEFEALLPLITEEEFGWGETYLSLVYMVGGAYLILEFLFIYKVGSKFKISDQSYVIASHVFTTAALMLLIAEQLVEERNIEIRVAISMVMCFFVFSGVPLTLVSIKSLVTRITTKEVQGTTQGVYSSLSRVFLATGPIMAAAAFKSRVIFGSVMVLFCLSSLIAFMVSLKRLQQKISEMKDCQ